MVILILPVATAHLCEYFICFLFFNTVFHTEKKPLTICSLGLILYSVVFAAYMIFDSIFVNIIATLIFNFIFGFVFYKRTVISSAFCSLFLSIALTSSEFIVMSVMSVGVDNDINAYKTSQLMLWLMTFLSRTVYLVIVMLVATKLPRSTLSRIPPFMLLVPIASTVTLYAIWSVSSKNSMSDTDSFLIIAASIGVFISILLTYIFYANTEKKLVDSYKVQTEAEKIKTDLAYYNILEQQNSNLRAYAHDTKNHLSAIKNLNTNPEIEIHISQMSESLAEYSKVCHSGNHTLDVVVDKYVTECNINGLIFEFDIKNNSLSMIEPYDMVTILGNLLDNALEAAKNSAQKIVSFETDYRNNFSIIIVSNSCNTNPMSDGKALPVTTKANKQLHGYGLKSVRNTLKKYNGDISFDYDEKEKVFVVTVMVDAVNK